MFAPEKKEGVEVISWEKYEELANKLASSIILNGTPIKNIYGIPRGGMVLAVSLSHKLGLPVITDEEDISTETLVCDEISDSGKTMRDFLKRHEGCYTASLFVDYYTGYYPNAYAATKRAEWLEFPWETELKLQEDNKSENGVIETA